MFTGLLAGTACCCYCFGMTGMIVGVGSVGCGLSNNLVTRELWAWCCHGVHERRRALAVMAVHSHVYVHNIKMCLLPAGLQLILAMLS